MLIILFTYDHVNPPKHLGIRIKFKCPKLALAKLPPIGCNNRGSLGLPLKEIKKYHGQKMSDGILKF